MRYEDQMLNLPPLALPGRRRIVVLNFLLFPLSDLLLLLLRVSVVRSLNERRELSLQLVVPGFERRCCLFLPRERLITRVRLCTRRGCPALQCAHLFFVGIGGGRGGGGGGAGRARGRGRRGGGVA